MFLEKEFDLYDPIHYLNLFYAILILLIGYLLTSKAKKI